MSASTIIENILATLYDTLSDDVKVAANRVEVWKPSHIVPRYEVSHKGNLRWAATGTRKQVTGNSVRVHGIRVKVAYMVADAFVAPIDGKVVLHQDGDGYNCAAKNLMVMTAAEWSKYKRRNEYLHLTVKPVKA